MIFPKNFKGSACKGGIGNAKVEYWSNDGGGGVSGAKRHAEKYTDENCKRMCAYDFRRSSFWQRLAGVLT